MGASLSLASGVEATAPSRHEIPTNRRRASGHIEQSQPGRSARVVGHWDGVDGVACVVDGDGGDAV